jgi:predicted AAA+ superfamily ATPase
LARATESRRRAWFNSYITTILQRDVRDIANIEGLTMLPRLLAILAARTSGLLNMADVSRTVALPYVTLHRYMSLLETTFLTQSLPAWSSNLTRRLSRTPKIMLSDTGLACALLGLNEARLDKDGELLGPLLENFIAMELRKLASWSITSPQIFHFRTGSGQEVDAVLEDATGRIVGIESKSSATIKADDFKGLRQLAELSGEKFVRGIVLYTGDNVIPFAANMHALPVNSLWQSF